MLNRTLDLAPLVVRTAAELGFAARHVTREPPGEDPVELRSDWVLLSREPGALPRAGPAEAERPPRTVEPWTDDFSNLAAILRL